ncbi:hypothetical protein ACJJID_16320 [Microbulbifer sp. CnH-101-G]|uniref:hypothetical protein n=1 Tax=Microbulbifer sp. CnH-101-G TaxID=3243393 RepID=UPI00403A2783
MKILKFNKSTKESQVLAIHYAKKLENHLLLEFVSSRKGIESSEEATLIALGFWDMTDLSIEDHTSNKSIEGIDNIEFWMQKIFNKVYGYMVKNGYKTQWQEISNKR